MNHSELTARPSTRRRTSAASSSQVGHPPAGSTFPPNGSAGRFSRASCSTGGKLGPRATFSKAGTCCFTASDAADRPAQRRGFAQIARPAKVAILRDPRAAGSTVKRRTRTERRTCMATRPAPGVQRELIGTIDLASGSERSDGQASPTRSPVMSNWRWWAPVGCPLRRSNRRCQSFRWGKSATLQSANRMWRRQPKSIQVAPPGISSRRNRRRLSAGTRVGSGTACLQPKAAVHWRSPIGASGCASRGLDAGRHRGSRATLVQPDCGSRLIPALSKT